MGCVPPQQQQERSRRAGASTAAAISITAMRSDCCDREAPALCADIGWTTRKRVAEMHCGIALYLCYLAVSYTSRSTRADLHFASLCKTVKSAAVRLARLKWYDPPGLKALLHTHRADAPPPRHCSPTWFQSWQQGSKTHAYFAWPCLNWRANRSAGPQRLLWGDPLSRRPVLPCPPRCYLMTQSLT